VRHVVLERWSRSDSILHRLDARAKLIVLLVYLVSLATLRDVGSLGIAAFVIFPLAGLPASRLPIPALLARSMLVLPFTLTFAAISFVAGEPERASAMLVKSYFSALAVLLVVASTPTPALFHAASSLGAPQALVVVLQFLYRYMFVVAEQAARMWSAALCRGAKTSRRSRKQSMVAASGMLAALFAKSYQRAAAIHKSMLARGFTGRIPLIELPRWRRADVAFLGVGSIFLLSARLLPILWP